MGKGANRYRFDVLTLDVPYAVTNPVHHVLKVAPSSVNTEGIAKCPVLCLAVVFHVINVAPRTSSVDINVRESVVKCVPRNIATNVQINSTLE
jgi:hypothetical protein